MCLEKNDDGGWKYGRRAIAKTTGSTEWYVRSVLERARATVGGSARLTPEQLDVVDILKHPEVRIVIPKTKPKAPRNNGIEDWVIVTDFHAPFHHEASCEVLYQVISDIQPTKIFVLGDLINLDAFCRYDKPPHHNDWWTDVQQAGGILGNLRLAAPNADLEWLGGNHEDRLKKYLMRHDPLLYYHLDMEKLFVLTNNEAAIKGWTYTPNIEKLFEDLRLVLVHGHKIRKHSGMSAFAHMDDLWLSVVIGHSHRLGIHVRSSGRSRYYDEQPAFGIECGCMCRYDIEYVERKTTNWQHGFAVLSIDRNVADSPSIEPAIVSVTDGVARFRGNRYTA
jgi:predicted phosphodiesterase